MDTDVLIVGAGPTGLMLACWLTRLGTRPLVIDKKEAGAIMRDLSLVFQPRLLSRSPQTRIDSVLLHGYTLRRREKTESLVLSIPEAR